MLLGLPGSGESAISATARPCFKSRSDDRGPRPQSVRNCLVSSFTMSATWSEHEHETFGLESLFGKKKASVAYLEVHDGRKALDLIDGNQILERLGVEGGDLVFVLVHCGLFFLITDRLELEQETV